MGDVSERIGVNYCGRLSQSVVPSIYSSARTELNQSLVCRVLAPFTVAGSSTSSCEDGTYAQFGAS